MELYVKTLHIWYIYGEIRRNSKVPKFFFEGEGWKRHN